MTELKDLLDRAGDDDGRPLRTDLEDLLARAERTRTRSRVRRITGAVVAAGAAATLVIGIAVTQGDHDGGAAPTSDADGGATGTTTEHPRLASLTATQVVTRCRTQLAAYSHLPMYTAHPDQADWTLAPGRYFVDQTVLVDPGDGSDPEFCRVPPVGHLDDRLPLSSYTGTASDTDLLTQNCRQLAPYSGSSFRLDHPESGGITAADTVDQVSAAVLVTRDGQAALCSISPVTWDAGITDVQRFDRGIALAYGTTGGGNKSIVGRTASWYLLGGVVSQQASTVELSVSGGPTQTFEVREGYVAGVLRDGRPGGLRAVSWRVLDDQGNVLRSGHES